jgi:putative modified peptide
VQSSEETRAAELLEKLLTDDEFRASFRRDPASACEQFDLPELATEFGGGPGGSMFHTLEIRESRSSLAGAFMAAASEGTGAVDHLKNLHDNHLHGEAHRVVHHALTSPKLHAIDPDNLHGSGMADHLDGSGSSAHLASPSDITTLLHNPQLTLSPEAHAALARGGADARLVSVLDDLTTEHQLRIGTLQVSHGAGGDSFDILSVDGERVSQSNIYARDLANELATLDPSLRPAQIVTPWPIEAQGFTQGGAHDDRIHIMFDAPSSSAPATHMVAGTNAPVDTSTTPDTGTTPPEPSTTPPDPSTAPPSSPTTPPPDPSTTPPAAPTTPPPDPTTTPAASPTTTPAAAPTTPPPEPTTTPPAPPVTPPPPAPTTTPPEPQGSGQSGSVQGGSVQGGSVQGGSVQGGSVQGGSAPPVDPTTTPPAGGGTPPDPTTTPPAAPVTPPPDPTTTPPAAPTTPPPAPTTPPAGGGTTPPDPTTTPAAPSTPPPEPVTPVPAAAPPPPPTHQSVVLGAVQGREGHSTFQFEVPASGHGAAAAESALQSFDPNAAGGLPDTADTYPGDNASQQAIAAWMARQAHKAGLPAELPIMAALTESGLKNDNYGDRDSLGFFQMRTSIWNQGQYAGFPDHPELQLKWFINQALEVRRERLSQGDASYGQDKSKWGDWVADVEQPAAEYRGRYQTHLDQADSLLSAGGPGAAGAGGTAGPNAGEAAAALQSATGGANPYVQGGYSTAGVQALTIAEKYIGTPYHWGGDTPQTGFDCSGLVEYSYAQLGIHVPRVAADQFNVGEHISNVNDLKPGDIVFFKDSTGYVHHEGLYIGNHMFLHAPHTGDVVKISSLDEPYYKEQFAGGSDVTGLATGTPAPPAGAVAAPVEPPAPTPSPAPEPTQQGAGSSGLFGAVSDSPGGAGAPAAAPGGGSGSTVQILPAVPDPNAPADD